MFVLVAASRWSSVSSDKALLAACFTWASSDGVSSCGFAGAAAVAAAAATAAVAAALTALPMAEALMRPGAELPAGPLSDLEVLSGVELGSGGALRTGVSGTVHGGTGGPSAVLGPGTCVRADPADAAAAADGRADSPLAPAALIPWDRMLGRAWPAAVLA